MGHWEKRGNRVDLRQFRRWASGEPSLWGMVGAVCVLAVCVFATPASHAQTSVPELPGQRFDYYGYAVTNLPVHFQTGALNQADNTPLDNQITNAGATLGRVLFYDKQLSHNFTVACASCHSQETGFSDTRQKSEGVNGETNRHSMALANSKFYENGRFFWDERAATLEDQVLMPIQDPVEMNLDLNTLVTRLTASNFYPELFSNAFGTSDVTSDRISKALSQFVRSMVSYQSRFDSIFDSNGIPDLTQLTPDEQRGFQVFHSNQGRCAQCHTQSAHVSDEAHNIGLDLLDTDPGAGDGEFKSPSLRNAEVRGRFMHDGRFNSLEEVIEFYSSGVQPNANLDPLLVDFETNFTQQDKDGLLAYLRSLTDWTFLSDPKFADPFVWACDFDGDDACSVTDLNRLLAEGPIADGVAVDGTNARYDLNADGVLDNLDTAEWLHEAALVDGLLSPYLIADANLDGVVDGQDFLRWNAGKFSSSVRWDEGDFNGDGVVDGQDFLSWNTNKFQSSDRPASLPEPSAGLLCLLAGTCLGALRRQRSPV